jgi:hypothetical protein
MEAQQRAIYANLLVDTVRRHAMLPSDVLQKISWCAHRPTSVTSVL